jgi:hypothetical protein
MEVTAAQKYEQSSRNSYVPLESIFLNLSILANNLAMKFSYSANNLSANVKMVTPSLIESQIQQLILQ